jgi:hypothetical protein
VIGGVAEQAGGLFGQPSLASGCAAAQSQQQMVYLIKPLFQSNNFGAMTGKQVCIARIAAVGDLPAVQLPVVVSPAVWGSNRPPRRA